MARVTKTTLQKKKEQGEKMTMLTAHDHPLARLMDSAGIDIVLIGDSLGNAVLGYENTLPVTMEEMLHHTKAVVRGVKNAMVIADMPFLSYQISVEDAVRNAGRFIKEGGAQAVKLEGASAQVLEVIQKLVSIGIPVMGHIGFTPQAVNQLGGYKVQGKDEAAVERLINEAKALEESGVFAMVLEMVPAKAAGKVTEALRIPVIGCGAGPLCDGQVVVLYDLLGISEQAPRFAKRYAELGADIKKAAEKFKTEVEKGVFPGAEHSF